MVRGTMGLTGHDPTSPRALSVCDELILPREWPIRPNVF